LRRMLRQNAAVGWYRQRELSFRVVLAGDPPSKSASREFCFRCAVHEDLAAAFTLKQPRVCRNCGASQRVEAFWRRAGRSA
jgi:hypothetical protein